MGPSHWCAIPALEHVADLEGWEGMVIHWSITRVLVPGLTASIASTTTPSGSADPDDPLSIHVDGTPQVMGPDAARAAGEALSARRRSRGHERRRGRA